MLSMRHCAPKDGPRKTVSNRNVKRPVGTTRDRALRQLRDQRPDLHARVAAKELSAHRAMIEAVVWTLAE
jgi:hypothetical protein